MSLVVMRHLVLTGTYWFIYIQCSELRKKKRTFGLEARRRICRIRIFEIGKSYDKQRSTSGLVTAS